MRGQRAANIVNRFDQSVGELFVSEMFAHMIGEALPQFIAALLMDRFVADDRELMGAGRNENQNVRVPVVLMKAEPLKSSSGCDQRVVFQLTALNKNANLAGRS